MLGLTESTPLIFLAKLKKQEDDLLLRLSRTPDILKEVSRHRRRPALRIFGFSLDVELNIGEGLRKLRSKDMDLIVVNTAESFDSSSISAVLIDRCGTTKDLGNISKQALATNIVSAATDDKFLPIS